MGNKTHSPEVVARCEWMMTGNDEWVFGIKLRGVVCYPLAEIYFDEDKEGPEGGWRWIVHPPLPLETQPPGGYTTNFEHAIGSCEESLGIPSRRQP